MNNKEIKTYLTRKEKALKTFDDLLDEARVLINLISEKNKIEIQANGVTYCMIDPFSDGELSDVISVEDGLITLENGSAVDVRDVTNVTDLIGLLDVIDA